MIEHVEDHSTAIKEMCRVAKYGASIIITVPAFNFLWSEHDIVNHHFRRYTKTDLENLINQSRLRKIFVSYFNFFLFPVVYLLRKMNNIKIKGTTKNKSDFKTFETNFFAKILYKIFESEKNLLQERKHFPFGVSIIGHYKKVN